jgi:hypothetical protein
MGCSDKKDINVQTRFDAEELLKFPSFVELVPGASKKLDKKKRKSVSRDIDKVRNNKSKPKFNNIMTRLLN